MFNEYLVIKSLHIIAVISWMAGMFYLPRLFVYHSKAEKGSEMDRTFQIMERRLLKIIINPAMIASYLLGIYLAYILGTANWGGWLHAKIALVLAMSFLHGKMVVYTKAFARGQNTRSENFYRLFNEIPTVLMVIIVFLVVVKPF